MRFLVVLLMFGFSFGCAQEKEVLVFHKTEGWHHESIPTGVRTIQELGEENNFSVTETDKSEVFSGNNLDKYDLVIFLNTTGNVLEGDQENVFENYIENGGNFFGIHAAADTEYDWEWYGKLVGAYFLDHPKVQEAEVLIAAPEHPTVSHLPHSWKRTDEWYNYKNINPDIEVLLYLNEDSYEGGKNGDEHPIAWYRELPSGGRTIYTGGGHTDEAFSEPLFREHLVRCILYAMKTNK